MARGFLDAVSAQQGLPPEELDKHFTAYPESVIQFLVFSMEEGGQPGFTDAYRLIDVLEGLDCHHIHVVSPEDWDPVVVRLQRADGLLLRASFTRAALNLSRPRLVTLVKEETGIVRNTETAAVIRGRRVEQSERRLEQPAGPGRPADPRGRKSDHVTQTILTKRPASAGGEEDDGLGLPNALGGWSWSRVLQQITAAASAVGCTKLQIGKVGTGGIVRLQASVKAAGDIDCYLAPNVIVDTSLLESAIASHIEKRKQRLAELDEVPDAIVSDTAEIEVGAAGTPAPPREPAPPPIEERLAARAEALGYASAATTLAGNGRYIRLSAATAGGRELVIACAIDSVAGLDDADLDARLQLLFARARESE
ncbi:MAG: hypothetical protein ACYTGX_16275 [Planctomycetota bacterium]